MINNEYIKEINTTIDNDYRLKLIDYATELLYHEATRSKYSGIYVSQEIDINNELIKPILNDFKKAVPDAYDLNVRFFKFTPHGTHFPHSDTSDVFQYKNQRTFLVPLYPDPTSDLYAPLLFWEDDITKIPYDWYNEDKAKYVVPKIKNGYIVNICKNHSVMNHTLLHRYNLQIRFNTNDKDILML